MRKNIFLIGRTNSRGHENQLTEMLAYLFQQHPELIGVWLKKVGLVVPEGDWAVHTQRGIESGFLDLVLEIPGRATVIVESKLGSTTDYLQIQKYLGYLAALPTGMLKALVFMTQKPEDLPAGVEREKQDDVELLPRRWQLMGDVLRSSEVELGEDFATMLEQEDMVTPDAIHGADVENWNTGVRVGRGLGTILDEATREISGLEEGLQKVGAVVYSGNGLIYRLFHFRVLSLGVGFWPVKDIAKVGELALVNGYVLNTTLPVSARKQAGQGAVAKAASVRVAMSGWAEHYVLRSLPLSEVLTEPDFAGQVTQMIEFSRETVAFFRALEYLPR